MADDEQKLDVAYLRSLIPDLSEDDAREDVAKLSGSRLFRLRQLSNITDAQLEKIGITLGVRSALLRQGGQLLHTHYPPHRIPPLTAGCRCVRAPARADAAVAPVTATVTGPALLLPTPFGPQATSLLTALLLHLSVALCLRSAGAADPAGHRAMSQLSLSATIAADCILCCACCSAQDSGERLQFHERCFYPEG